MFPTFEIFGRQIGMYGVMAVLGFAVCFLVGRLLIRRFDINIYDFALVMVAAGIGLVITACLFYGLSNIRIVIYALSRIGEIGWESFWVLIKYAFGGIVFYGGFIGGAIAILIYTKFSKDLKGHRDHRQDRLLSRGMLLRRRERFRVYRP